MNNRYFSYIAWVAFCAVAYFLGAKASGFASSMQNGIMLLWLPAGLAVSLLLLRGIRLWPGIALGALVYALLDGRPPTQGLLFGFSNAIEAVVIAFLLTRVAHVKPTFDRPQDILGFLIYAMLLGSGIGTLLDIPRLILSMERYPFWWANWMSHAVGILLITPVVLTWASNHKPNWNPLKATEFTVLASALVGLCMVVFINVAEVPIGETFPYLLFPLLLWAGLRFGQREVATLTLTMSVFAIWGATKDLGPFMTANEEQNLINLYLYLGVMAITAMVLAAEVRERGTAQQLAIENQAQYSELIDTMNEGLVAQDNFGKISLVNNRFCSMLGYTSTELIGKSIRDLVAPGYCEAWDAQQIKRRTGANAPYTLDVAAKYGSVITLLVSPIF